LAFRIGESIVREVVKEVCQVLIKVLEPFYLSSPTEEDWRKCAQGYWKKWNFPNCVGSVDGKHVRLHCPLNSGSLYFNYKKFFIVSFIVCFIVLLAVSDHLYKFTLVDIEAYGGKQEQIKNFILYIYIYIYIYIFENKLCSRQKIVDKKK